MDPVKMFKKPGGVLSQAAARREQGLLSVVGLSAKPEWKKGSFGQATFGQSIQDRRQRFPIYNLKKELVQVVRDNPILVIIGEKGSAISTQVSQYLAEAGYTTRGQIGCTQPRRIGAMSVEKRVADEFGCRIGKEVGYSILFQECSGPYTVMKYMKDVCAKQQESDYLDAALITVMQIHLTEPGGDILVFLTCQEEIDHACQFLYERMKEASLTLDGIFYVIDPGFAKQNVYNHKQGLDSLVITPISQASAKHRAGHAG
ncbi:hypothetical protein RHMOL_Rhmol05G0019400 [Rhododendron molle]|uniref:Uncharacterized protein n=1 Tax=Rhododendron molle TaxID=49168 RepID=A0ACC0NLN2_RHOML|nr:hypothetical protein RHMOL_Rhmol05G0019400 [Rhododendron molle]